MDVIAIMAKSPAVCTPATPIGDVARMLVEHDCGALPVVNDRTDPRPVGVITDRDIVVRLVAAGRNPLECTARDAMSPDPATVRAHASVEEAAGIMERNQVRRLPVVDAEGRVIGMLAQADIALNAPSGETAEVLRELSEEEAAPAEQMPLGGAYSG